MFNTSFFQLVILIFLLFLLFGDFNKLFFNLSEFKNYFKKKEKKD